MGSAQLDLEPEAETALPAEPAASTLRLEAAARLAAHRERRARKAAAAAAPPPAPGRPVLTARTRAGVSAAERVAQRYANAPSFRAALADEARRAIEQAAAEAEIALRNAEAVTAAQQELLAELMQYETPVAFTPETATVTTPVVAKPLIEVPSAGLTVKLYEDAGRPAQSTAPLTRSHAHVDLTPEEVSALDEEIAFRHAPVFEDYAALLAAAKAAFLEPAVPLPANLLEFPRQLVATRKARPRLAEGPLRDDAPRSPQLRIFEVEPEQIAHTPEPLHSAPEWSSIWLDAHTVTEPVQDPDTEPYATLPSLLPKQVAPVQARLMAALMDMTLVAAAFVAFTAAAAAVASRMQAPLDAFTLPALIAAGTTLTIFWFLYQLLFFSLSGQTLGMRFARVGLCTFTDENPSRAAMRRRLLGQVVALCPLGLGILWVVLDEEHLGWHDRISRMYQRAY